jgi:hypothetical protein
MERRLRGLGGLIRMGNEAWEWSTGMERRLRGLSGLFMMEMEHGLDGFDGWAWRNGTQITRIGRIY